MADLTLSQRVGARISRSKAFRRFLGPKGFAKADGWPEVVAHLPTAHGYIKVTDRDLRVFALERA